ncbi:DUF6946 family protein [Thiorhodovibrio frisius]|uniref:DUF6946 domain-containing protein n=1 Tax=Thiorhodovibrio frisius TaxID=631362 RepID=H8YWP6_9GAMM|nr:hypothetical protein [Thiorhodovibrio frisius]EIC22872.1 hypothetical protein Thi970DRAFT_00510 [Thiorhodovibrio frisius]WPL22869.1 hypothetical protein Thiofri_03046 [Thiorhodovibrio frisius]
MESFDRVMRFFYNQKSVTPGNWLAEYKDSEFNSPTRSTVPLLDALRQEQPPVFLWELLKASGLNPEATDLHLEYQVKPSRGRGQASHTDLMAIEAAPANRALAVEAKWTEPRYETVSKWLGGGTAPENRRLVLRGWLDQIESHAAGTIATDDCGELIYQMVHRAASAVSASGPGGHPAMAYLVFHDGDAGHLDDCRSDLCRLRSAIGKVEGFPFFLVFVPLHETDAFCKVKDLKKGDAETGRAVRQSLAQGSLPLFRFGKPHIERI